MQTGILLGSALFSMPPSENNILVLPIMLLREGKELLQSKIRINNPRKPLTHKHSAKP
jgi:hypothetical protein